MDTDYKKLLKDAYVIVPVYNVSTTDLPFTCGEWQLIDKEYFYKNYTGKISIVSSELKKDIACRKERDVYGRPLADYILIKKFKKFHGYNKYVNPLNNDIYEQEKLEIDLLITSFRLVDKGFIQVNRAYIFSNDSQYDIDDIKTSNPLKDIGSYKPYGEDGSGPYYEMHCLLDKNDFDKAVNLLPALKKSHKKLFIPLYYFNEYFKFRHIEDKMINLSIIWESTILNEIENGLKKTLVQRGSSLFGVERGDILKLAYEVRSKIVHTGDVPSDILEQVKTFITQENHPVALVYFFIQNYLEPITVEIIKYFVSELDKNGNLSIKKIA